MYNDHTKSNTPAGASGSGEGIKFMGEDGGDGSGETSGTAVAPAGRMMEDPATFASELPSGVRIIGIDLGTKTIGLALSDVTRMIASPLETIRRTKLKADLARLSELVGEHRVRGFVMGLPRSLDGSDGPRVQATRAFVRNLNQAIPLPVLLWDERLTTAVAERMLIAADQSRKRRAEVIDKLAATLILQSALDRISRLP
jgi:putative Holliday junction resolvase